MKRILALILCLCLLLAGCGSGDPVSHTPTGAGLTWDTDETLPEALQTEPGQEELGLVLTFYPDVTLNPFSCTDYTNRALFSLLYQGLFCVDRSYTVQPQLCERFTVSKDMRKYTFYVEPTASLSDGTRLTAADVLASLNAARESLYYGGRFGYINEMYLSEDGGVTITLHTPYENLPLLLDIPIIAESQLEEDRPLGSGPYVLQAGTAGGSLRKRAGWWCDGELLFQADSIRLVAAESATQIRDNFEFYDVNLVCSDPNSDHRADYRCDYELWDCENGLFLYLACSADSSVFSNETVRAALTHAIDRDLLVTQHYQGFARSATLPASPLSPYYSQALAGRYTYDPTRFLKAVENAGLRDANVKLMVNSEDSLRVRVARAIGKMLEDSGLTVTMMECTGWEYENAMLNRTYDLYLGQTKLSPNMDLSEFFAPYGELSYGGVNNVALYELCQQALENHGNYYTLHKAVMEDGMLCPVISGSYAVYATRGLITDLAPARDNIFAYSMGRTLEEAMVQLDA